MGRALEELGIQWIPASSPQAKGRVERLWQTFQDRLRVELRLAGAKTLEEANQVLGAFLPKFNARFSVPARQPGLAYRPLPEGLDPKGVLCFKYRRVVASDNTVQFARGTLQIPPTPKRASYARARVEVQERLDGTLVVVHDGVVLATREAPPGPVTLRARKSSRSLPDRLVGRVSPAGSRGAQGPGGVARGPAEEGRPDPIGAKAPRKPAPDHPWKKSLLTKSLHQTH